MAHLLVEVLRQVHTDPHERNVYVNPRRADQAIVYIPEHWETCQLDEAGRLLFERIVDELENLPPPELTAREKQVITAAKQSFQNSAQLAKTSRAALTAHLENLRQQTVHGEGWLGEPPAFSESRPLAYFQQERISHLSPDGVIAAVETAAGLYDSGQVTEAAGPELARKALLECARQLLHGRTENLTVLPGPPGEVYVHLRTGWGRRPRERAAAQLARKIASVLSDQIEASSGPSPLRRLLPWLRSRLDEGVGEEILARYLSVAEVAYGSLSPQPELTDSRSVARRLLAQDAPGAALDRLEPAQDAPGAALDRLEPAQLTDGELAALLGFAL